MGTLYSFSRLLNFVGCVRVVCVEYVWVSAHVCVRASVWVRGLTYTIFEGTADTTRDFQFSDTSPALEGLVATGTGPDLPP